MKRSRVFYVGLLSEVSHHAAPLQDSLSVEIVDPVDVRKIAQPGDLAIFYSEHFDRFREAVSALKERQVATLYQIDGILEWRNAWENRPEEPACPFTMRPVLAHKVACIGPSQARVLNCWGNRGKVEVVGVPRFDRLQSSPERNQPDPTKFRVLVVTAKSPGFTQEQNERTLQSLFNLKSWIENEQQTRRVFPQRQLEVQWRLTGGLDTKLQIENRMTEASGKELVDQLRQADALISTPSTAMLEGSLLGLPVASLDYHGCPSYVQTAWSINHAGAIPQIMAELADPPAQKMFFQKMLLQDSLVIHPDLGDQTATARMVRLVQAMQSVAQRQVESDQTLHFPERILEPVSLGDLTFDHGQLYPGYEEFKHRLGGLGNRDQLTLTAVELAHARREIEYLQRELAQCKSELRQAHAIFEQIHQHPVAGPIVRLRQKFLDWYSRNQSLDGK